MDDLYNKVLSEFYGINCDKCKVNEKLLNYSNLTDSFWLDYMIKKLNINNQCQVNLQTQLV